MNNNPLVSVVIPHYNNPIALNRAISSIKSQEYDGECEIIVIDDGSTLLPRYSANDVTVLINERNYGPGYSRNVGLDVSKGELIGFLDCDDIWLHDFLKTLVPIIINSENSFVYGKGKIVKDGNMIGYRPKKWTPRNRILPYLYTEDRQWGTSGVLWNKEFLNKIGGWKALRVWEDFECDTRMGIANNKIQAVNEILWVKDIGDGTRINRYFEKSKSLVCISTSIKRSHFINNNELIHHLTNKNLRVIKQCVGEKSHLHAFKLFWTTLLITNSRFKFIIDSIKGLIKHLAYKN